MPKHNNAPIPQHNVLDLRAIAAAREAADVRPRRRLRLPQLPPVRQPQDWVKLRRETLKFFVIILVAAIPIALTVSGLRFASAAADIASIAREGMTALESGATAVAASNSVDATSHFTAAHGHFSQAERKLRAAVPYDGISAFPYVGPRYTTAASLIQAGQRFADAGNDVAAMMADVDGPLPGFSVTSDGIVSGSIGFLGPLVQHGEEFRQAVDHLEAAAALLNNADPDHIGGEHAEALRLWQRLYSALDGGTGRLGDLAGLLQSMFASPEPKEYLVLFQNHDELRATGGFIGTYLLVKFEAGTFKILDAPGNGPYALTEQVPKTMLPPQPIFAVAPHWTFQDANWFLDVPTSSRALMDMYKQARGFEPDGVMYITPGIVEDLLRVTGPLTVNGVSVDADTFVRQIEREAEFEYDKALNAPKQVLIDMVPLLLQKLSTLDQGDALRAFTMLMQHADQRNVMAYARTGTTGDILQRLGWDGRISDESNFLAVVDSNLGGGKTDRVIAVDVAVHITISGEAARHDVRITRKHTGTPGDPLAGVVNKDFIRVYTPATSTLIGVEGESDLPSDFFKTPTPGTQPTAIVTEAEGKALLDPLRGIRSTRESGKNVFGAWSILEPGEEQVMTISYTVPLPRQEETEWRLYWQKQPGTPLRTWSVRLEVTDGRVTKVQEPSVERSRTTVQFQTDSTLSRIFSATIHK